MPSIPRFAARLLAALFTACVALYAAAQQPAAIAPPPSEAPLKEIPLAPSAFVRAAPLPPWADLLPLPSAAPASRAAIAMRLEDTQLWVADTPVQLVNAAQQVNDAGALGQIGQIAIAFVPQYQRLLLHKVAIVRGDAVIDHTASVPVRFLQREAGLEQGIYSGVITASLLLPDVRVGDTLHLQYSIVGANPIFGARYVHAAPWQRPIAVPWRRVTISHPESRTIRWQWIGDGAATPTTATTAPLAPEVTTKNGIRRLRFEERDVAGVEIETALPRGTFPLRWLQFSEFADWAEVARWADALFPADAPLPAELVPLVQRWLRLPSRDAQASQALQWVQAEIRYYSIALGESSHRPHAPAEVLRNRYGDCKDKSLLLMRLLQSLGIPARAMLASLAAPPAPGKLLASPLAFDHVVVQARIDGRDFTLDPTRQGQRGALEWMGQGLEDASVLVVDRDATQGLSVVRSPNRRELFHNELSEHFRLDAFDADGELETRQQFTGLAAETLRLTAARLEPARLQRNLVAALERRYPGIAALGTPELTDEVDRNRITLRAKYKVPKLAVASGSSWVMRFVPANMQGTFIVPPTATRRFALALPAYPVAIDYEMQMQWPASVAAALDPGTLRIANPSFVAEVARSFRGNVARASLRFEPLAAAVPAPDVAALLDDVKKVEAGIGGAVVVAREQIKDGGFLGRGRKALQDTLRARAQATVERSSVAIAGASLGGDDLAQALCLRAEAQLQLDRLDLALQDAQRAVREAPSLASAWLCQGNVEWARAEFAPAAADFGKALVLGHNPAAAYVRRGQARFYEGRLEHAADDFVKAAAERAESADPAYALLWQGWTLQRLGRPLPAALLALADPSGAWPRPALALLAGKATPDEVLAQIARKDGDEREFALAEGYFYIGQHHLMQGQTDAARAAFEQVRAKGITIYVEHTAAGFELQRLSEKRP